MEVFREVHGPKSKNRMPGIVEAGALAIATTVKHHNPTFEFRPSYNDEKLIEQKPHTMVIPVEPPLKWKINTSTRLMTVSLVTVVAIILLASTVFKKWKSEENVIEEPGRVPILSPPPSILSSPPPVVGEALRTPGVSMELKEFEGQTNAKWELIPDGQTNGKWKRIIPDGQTNGKLWELIPDGQTNDRWSSRLSARRTSNQQSLENLENWHSHYVDMVEKIFKELCEKRQVGLWRDQSQEFKDCDNMLGWYINRLCKTTDELFKLYKNDDQGEKVFKKTEKTWSEIFMEYRKEFNVTDMDELEQHRFVAVFIEYLKTEINRTGKGHVENWVQSLRNHKGVFVF